MRFCRHAHAYWKAKINNLLSICYEHLGDWQRGYDARRHGRDADPQNVQQDRTLAEAMVARGGLDQGIDEYRKLVGKAPQLRGMLASLLMAQVQRRLPGNRDWSEVESLDQGGRESGSQSSESIVLRANLLTAQGGWAMPEAGGRRGDQEKPRKIELLLKSAELSDTRAEVYRGRANAESDSRLYKSRGRSA